MNDCKISPVENSLFYAERLQFSACGKEPPWIATIVRGTSYAAAGNAKRAEVQKAILEKLGLPPENVVTCQQVHGDNIEVVLGNRKKIYPETDGLITDVPGIVLGVFTADCVPVFLIDPHKKIVALLHAGWRGTVKEIVRKGVEKIKRKWNVNPADFRVFIGPHIQRCCYEVGPAVAGFFRRGCREKRGGKIYVGLQDAIIRQLQDSGVSPDNIVPNFSCSYSDKRFISYRRDNCPDRMLSFIAWVS